MMSGGGGGVKVINETAGQITVQAGFVDKESGNFEASAGAFSNSAKPVPAPNPDGSGGVFGVDQGLKPSPQGKDRGLKITLPNNESSVINRGDGGRHAVRVKGTNGSYTIEVAKIEGNVDLPDNDKNKIVQYCNDWAQVYPPQPETQSE